MKAAGATTVGALALVSALTMQPHVLYDDAAITFRYVERFVAGRGLTYNDHERVQGLSTPLYALILASATASGLNVESAARGVAAISYVLSAVLTSLIAGSLAGPAAGWLAGLALIADAFYRQQLLCGMESGLSVVLGLAALFAIRRGHELLAGVILGLALWNKLDASLLVLAAIAAAAVVRRGSAPRRLAAVAGAIGFAWLVLARAYYGAVLPQSLVTKLARGGTN